MNTLASHRSLLPKTEINTLLIDYCRDGNLRAVTALLDSGAQASADSTVFSHNPMREAAAAGHLDVVGLLYARGAVVHDAETCRSTTPLHSAVAGRHSAIVQFLLAHGADPNAEDEWGCTPLLTAALLGDKEIIQLLLSNGADVHCEDKRGQTAMSMAMQGYERALHDLILRGEMHCDHPEEAAAATIPSWPELSQFLSIARLLRERGAVLHGHSATGETIGQWAARYDFTAMSDVLSTRQPHQSLACRATTECTSEVAIAVPPPGHPHSRLRAVLDALELR